MMAAASSASFFGSNRDDDRHGQMPQPPPAQLPTSVPVASTPGSGSQAAAPQKKKRNMPGNPCEFLSSKIDFIFLFNRNGTQNCLDFFFYQKMLFQYIFFSKPLHPSPSTQQIGTNSYTMPNTTVNLT
jgi:hypothetical protein